METHVFRTQLGIIDSIDIIRYLCQVHSRADVHHNRLEADVRRRNVHFTEQAVVVSTPTDLMFTSMLYKEKLWEESLKSCYLTIDKLFVVGQSESLPYQVDRERRKLWREIHRDFWVYNNKVVSKELAYHRINSSLPLSSCFDIKTFAMNWTSKQDSICNNCCCAVSFFLDVGVVMWGYV